MFERYTERARRVLFFARYEASQLGSIAIKSEHLLLGLIREGKGLTSRIFARHHVSLAQISSRIQAQTTLPTPGRDVGRDSVHHGYEKDSAVVCRRGRSAAAQLHRHRASAPGHPPPGAIDGGLDPDRDGIEPAGRRDEIVSLLAEKVTVHPENEVPVVPTSDEHVVVSRDVFRHLPSYLPSRTLHVSFSRQGAVGAGWFESPHHWIMLGAELKSVIARAYGVDQCPRDVA